MKKSEKLAKKRLKRNLKNDPEFRMRFEYCLKDVMFIERCLVSFEKAGITYGT